VTCVRIFFNAIFVMAELFTVFKPLSIKKWLKFGSRGQLI
jgi:hypothetical protein